MSIDGVYNLVSDLKDIEYLCVRALVSTYATRTQNAMWRPGIFILPNPHCWQGTKAKCT